jgi:hypothetical protein
MGPDGRFRPTPNFLLRLQRVARTRVPAPDAPSLIFETNLQALAHNAHHIAKAGDNLSQLLHQNRKTTLHFGSEFRPITQLEDILGGHSLFGQLCTILMKGMDFRFKTELSESDRLLELTPAASSAPRLPSPSGSSPRLHNGSGRWPDGTPNRLRQPCSVAPAGVAIPTARHPGLRAAFEPVKEASGWVFLPALLQASAI